jgi:hypothetical protein
MVFFNFPWALQDLAQAKNRFTLGHEANVMLPAAAPQPELD